MPVTLTIKQVPDQLAAELRQRAAANHRSLQKELLLIMERAATESHTATAEPAPPAYHIAPARRAQKARAGKPATGRLSLEALWQRARQLGAPMLAESADLIRRDRDTRHGH